jgi:hypothetical protein
MRKSFPFEYEKYIAGTAFLNRREKGAYVDLLCYQADKGNMTLQDIKNILNGDFECWEKLKSKFTEEDGKFYNKKLESVKRHKKTEVEIIEDRKKLELQISEKKLKFYEDCKPFLEKYPKEMLRRFYNYWIELNKSGTRMRYELERTFEISRRLTTWANNDKGFNKADKNEFISYEELLERFNKGDVNIWKMYEKVVVNGRNVYQRKKIIL